MAKAIDFYGQSTSFSPKKPLDVLFPKHLLELQTMVLHMNQKAQPFMVVSVGKNWAYGDATPNKEGVVLISLEKMNQIIEVNPEFGFAVIEPGVTQKQMYDHIQKAGFNLKLDVTGAGEATSIVGNVLERGFGHTRFGDRSQQVCELLVMTPAGDLIEVGWNAFRNAQASNTSRNAFGPDMSGLFFQSDLGIVVRMTLWLQQKPKKTTYFFLRSSKNELADLMNRLIQLRKQNVIQSCVHTGNIWRAVSAQMNHEEFLQKFGVHASEEVIAQTLELGVWSSAGVIEGHSAVVKAQAREIKKTFSEYRPVILSDKTVQILVWLNQYISRIGLLKKLSQMIFQMQNVTKLLSGEPSSYALQGAMWKLPKSSINIHQDLRSTAAKQFCLSPVFPASGEKIELHLQKMIQIVRQYSFEPMITLTLVNERSVVAVVNVDFEIADFDPAFRCQAELTQYMLDQGLYPYRLNIETADAFWEACHNNERSRMLKKLKKQFDPLGLMHQTRYYQK